MLLEIPVFHAQYNGAPGYQDTVNMQAKLH